MSSSLYCAIGAIFSTHVMIHKIITCIICIYQMIRKKKVYDLKYTRMTSFNHHMVGLRKFLLNWFRGKLFTNKEEESNHDSSNKKV